jgi:hypothetical protein
MRHEHLPRHSARLVNEVVHVGPRLGGHHAALASPIQVTSDIRMILAFYTPTTEGMQDCATAALEETLSRSGC